MCHHMLSCSNIALCTGDLLIDIYTDVYIPSCIHSAPAHNRILLLLLVQSRMVSILNLSHYRTRQNGRWYKSFGLHITSLVHSPFDMLEQCRFGRRYVFYGPGALAKQLLPCLIDTAKGTRSAVHHNDEPFYII